MIYILPTKRGLGVQLWGTYEDLNGLYDILSKFWSQEDLIGKEDFDSRDKVIGGFVYEIRKAYSGNRLVQNHNHFTLEELKHFGCEISWVHILFSLSSIRYNMRYIENNKLDLSMMLQLEYWVEKAMNDFDPVGAIQLKQYISDGIFHGNPYVYLYMRSINADYFELGGGKTAFRRLPQLLKTGICYTEEFNRFETFLEKEAKRLNCKISELEMNDEEIDYDGIKW